MGAPAPAPAAWMAEAVVGARVGRLATLDPDGRAHLVPFCFALAGAALYSAVDQKPKRSRDLRRLRNIRARPQAAVLVDHWDEDWSRLWWVRMRGPARVLGAGAGAGGGADEREAAEALALLAAKYEQYRREPPAGPVIAIQIEEWQGWRAS